ncbi:Fusaric acid resistance protein-like [Cetobacterium ceti]|uniref:Fusaric acid resistance protein-like n=1 Tax=Cetobacterium ceti TaxID=180163 RepID=A0A1T4L7Z2_9FUSO|nr:FUSC family protein [Cetobacterium ceti]SJZ50842.1 Fusaric acid resistance protein-like [Cetobacterium ceti]
MRLPFNSDYLGNKNFKTAVSVFLCVLILNVYLHENSFYAAIASVSCSQSSPGSSLKSGISRTIGTSWGGFIGLVFSILIIHGEPTRFVQAFYTGIGIGFVILGCIKLLNKPSSCTIACIVYLGIIVNMNGRDPYFWAINRVLTTIFGIFITVTVHALLPPDKENNK